MTRIDVKTVVDIPGFLAVGKRFDGRDYVRLEDVCAYLSTVAARFDDAGANSDISLTLRAIRDGLVNTRSEMVS